MALRGVFAAGAVLLFGSALATADETSVVAASGARVQSSFVGISSYYGPGFHGRRTADGETFDIHGITAANKTLPIPCYARVTNLGNGLSMIVRVNDRGPYVAGRILDVSERVARLLNFGGGMSRVRVDYLAKAGPAGADDQRALLASLRTGNEPLVVKLKPSEDDGVTVVERRAPPLAFAAANKPAPATAALDAALRSPPVAMTPLTIASQLDASLRRLETALEATHRAADAASQQVANAVSPYGELVLAPFKPMMEASR